MTTIKSILYPTDFSEHSLVALPLAVDLAKHYNAQLHFLHVVDTTYDGSLQSEYILSMMNEIQINREEQQRHAKAYLKQFVHEHLPGLQESVVQVVSEGKPFEEIVHYARQTNIDLIVIGTHGHSALTSMFLGSVAEKVVRKAPCAVLSVRHPEHVFKAP